MNWQTLHDTLIFIKYIVSLIGILIIVTGVFFALFQYCYFSFKGQLLNAEEAKINNVRLNLGRILILGLEFIVAADLIGTINAPDYYAVGLLAIIVLVRTMLTFSISHEMKTINQS